MRLTNEQLDKVKTQYGVDDIWSYSRIDTYRTSPWEYYLKYIKHEKPLGKVQSAYGVLGGIAHDILEQYYNGELEYDQLLDEYENQYALQVDMLGLRFDKSDDEKNEKIGRNYYENMREFFQWFKPIKNEDVRGVKMESFVPIKISDDILLQGYIDQIYLDKDNQYHIVDFKTSSLYKGQDMINHSHQLVLYSEGIRQKGIVPDRIHCGFNFLKYVKYNYVQVNKEHKTQIIERNKLDTVAKKAYSWMKKNKIDKYEEIYELIQKSPYFINRVKPLVDAGFKIEDCYEWIENPFEIYKELQQEIIQTVNEINILTKEYYKTKNEKLWWDTDENCKKQEYYFSNLCDYSYDQLRPFKAWKERQTAEMEAANDLLGVMCDNKKESNDWMDDLFG